MKGWVKKLKNKIICALDIADPKEARRMVEKLDSRVKFFKVGALLYLTGGNRVIKWILDRGNRVFLDLKLYDVPSTVFQAVEQAALMGVTFLTVHGNREILRKAVEAAGISGMKLLAVTVLTSLDQADILDMGYPCPLEELVMHRARQAHLLGCGGVIASPREAARLKAAFGDQFLVVTPGIRPAGGQVGGHKRASTPRQAIRAGADYLVIGQPVIQAPDPETALLEIIKEMESRS